MVEQENLHQELRERLWKWVVSAGMMPASKAQMELPGQ